PAPQPGVRGAAAAGAGGSLRTAGGVPGGALGGDALVAVVFEPGRERTCDRGPGAAAGPRPGLRRPGGGPLRPLRALPGREFPPRRHAGRAEPGAVDPAGLARVVAPDWIPALAGVGRPVDARPRQRGVADVRRVAAVHAGLRPEHHAVQAD